MGPNGRIIAWHHYNGVMISSRFELSENTFIHWWMPYPKKPEGEADVSLIRLKKEWEPKEE